MSERVSNRISFFRMLNNVKAECTSSEMSRIEKGIKSLYASLPAVWFDPQNFGMLQDFVNRLDVARLTLVSAIEESIQIWSLKKSWKQRALIKALLESGGEYSEAVLSVYPTKSTTRVVVAKLSDELYDTYKVGGVPVADYLMGFGRASEVLPSQLLSLAELLTEKSSKDVLWYLPSRDILGFEYIFSVVSASEGEFNGGISDCEKEISFLRGLDIRIVELELSGLDMLKLKFVIGFIERYPKLYQEWVVERGATVQDLGAGAVLEEIKLAKSAS